MREQNRGERYAARKDCFIPLPVIITSQSFDGRGGISERSPIAS